MSMNAGSIVATLDLQTRAFSKGINSAMQQLNTFSNSSNSASERITALGGAMTSIGGTLTKNLTVPLVGAGAVITNLAMDYETSLAKVSTIADTSSVSLGTLSKGIMDLSNKTGIAATDLNEALYQSISAGVDTASSVSFLGEATKLAKAGFADATSTVDVLTTVLNAYGMEASEVTRVSDVLIQSQNLGKTTVGELSTQMGRVIPTANAYGVSLENLSAAYVETTKNGIGTAESTTYINSMLNELGKSGTNVSDIIKSKTGKSFQDLMKEGASLGEVMKILDDYATESGLSLGDLFGSSEAAKAGMVLAKNAGQDFNSTLEQLSNSAGSTNEAFEKVSNTTQEKFTRSLNELKNVGVELGTNLLPIVTDVTGGISGLVRKFNELDSSTQSFIVNAGLVTAAIGPIMSIGGKLIAGIGTIGTLAAATAINMHELYNESSIYKEGCANLGDTTVKWKSMSDETVAAIKPLLECLETIDSKTGEPQIVEVTYDQEQLQQFMDQSAQIEAILSDGIEKERQLRVKAIQDNKYMSEEAKQFAINQVNEECNQRIARYQQLEADRIALVQNAAAENRELTMAENMQLMKIENEMAMEREIQVASNEEEVAAIKEKYRGLEKNQLMNFYKENKFALEEDIAAKKKTLEDSYNKEYQMLKEAHEQELKAIQEDNNKTTAEKWKATQDANQAYEANLKNLENKTSNSKAALQSEITDGWLPYIQQLYESGAITDQIALEMIESILGINDTPIDIEDNSTDVKAKINELIRQINGLDGKNATVTVTTRNVSVYETQYQKSGASKYATGTENAMPGIASIAEYGAELIQSRSGELTLATSRQLVNMDGGETVYNARQTNEILKGMSERSNPKDINIGFTAVIDAIKGLDKDVINAIMNNSNNLTKAIEEIELSSDIVMDSRKVGEAVFPTINTKLAQGRYRG